MKALSMASDSVAKSKKSTKPQQCVIDSIEWANIMPREMSGEEMKKCVKLYLHLREISQKWYSIGITFTRRRSPRGEEVHFGFPNLAYLAPAIGGNESGEKKRENVGQWRNGVGVKPPPGMFIYLCIYYISNYIYLYLWNVYCVFAAIPTTEEEVKCIWYQARRRKWRRSYSNENERSICVQMRNEENIIQ